MFVPPDDEDPATPSEKAESVTMEEDDMEWQMWLSDLFSADSKQWCMWYMCLLHGKPV